MSNTSLLGSYGAQDSSSLMFRNVLINGNFDVWQRGVSATNTGDSGGSYVSADRWKFLTHTSNVGWVDGTLTQTTDTPSADIKYGVKVVSTSAALDDVVVFQTVEAINAQSLVGKSATLSFWYKKGAGLAAAKTFKYAVRYLNTADVGTNQPLNMGLTTLIQEATISSGSMSSAWAKITMTIPVMPSQAANGVVVEFRLDDDNFGSGDLLFLAQVQLEAGPTATPFERRPIGTELALCQRYYWRVENKGAGTDVLLGLGMGLGPNTALFAMHLPVTMRVAPSISGSCVVANASASIINPSTAFSQALSQTGIASTNITCTNPSLSANTVYRVLLNSSTAFFAANAEL